MQAQPVFSGPKIVTMVMWNVGSSKIVTVIE
jgi:hypothetical protein